MDGELITPPLASGCLPGVTRALVLDLCTAENIPVEQVDTPLSELQKVDAAFLTSTLRGVQPVDTVDGVKLREVGGDPVRRIQLAFNALCANQSDP